MTREFVYDMGSKGRVFATRGTAGGLREELVQRLQQNTDITALAIDLSGVEVMSNSFADELLGKLLAGMRGDVFPKLPVYVVGLSPDVRETVATVLARRKEMVLDYTSGAPNLLGEVPPHAGNALRFVIGHPGATAAQLADEEHGTVQAANKWLKDLLDTGLVEREGSVRAAGGREFRYTANICGSLASAADVDAVFDAVKSAYDYEQ